jgi:hypothetical protein
MKKENATPRKTTMARLTQGLKTDVQLKGMHTGRK